MRISYFDVVDAWLSFIIFTSFSPCALLVTQNSDLALVFLPFKVLCCVLLFFLSWDCISTDFDWHPYVNDYQNFISRIDNYSERQDYTYFNLYISFLLA